MTTNRVIDALDVRKHFGPIHAADDVSLSIRQGEIYGLLGPSAWDSAL